MSGHKGKEANARLWKIAQETTKVIFQKLKAQGLDQLPAETCILCGHKLSKRVASTATFCDKDVSLPERARHVTRPLLYSAAPCDFSRETSP
jgi:hypothetical protein